MFCEDFNNAYNLYLQGMKKQAKSALTLIREKYGNDGPT